jgi:heme/copper-type cytochrome/quinol oxidase subunit 4
MRVENEENMRETETAFVLSLILTNLLILIVLIGIVWLLHSAITAGSELSMFLRSTGIWP